MDLRKARGEKDRGERRLVWCDCILRLSARSPHPVTPFAPPYMTYAGRHHCQTKYCHVREPPARGSCLCIIINRPFRRSCVPRRATLPLRSGCSDRTLALKRSSLALPWHTSGNTPRPPQ